MSTVRVRRRGPASKYTIWARYRDPQRWPDWAPYLREVRTNGQLLRAGLEGEMHTRLGLTVAFEVLEVDEGAGRWTWVLRAGPLRYRVENLVEEGRAGMVITGPGPAVLASVPVAKRALGRIVRR
ncbi:MAG TPA: SRPBCC family protein [Actinomycetota bacterium]